MKIIKLTKNKETIIDDEDYIKVSAFNWCFDGKGYAMRKDKKKTLYLHRFISDCPHNKIIDHSNGNKLDNRKSNLRICTQKENQANRVRNCNNKTGVKGVRLMSWGKYQARSTVNGIQHHLGYFNTIKEAQEKYLDFLRKNYGEFAKS